MRVSVTDIGTNSTRVLLADVDEYGRVSEELLRRSTVTRLGQGVDASGALREEAMERVYAALAEHGHEVEALGGADVLVGVLTSAVRDASNGAAFTETVRERFGIDARTITGDEEARLTFAGATDSRDPDAPSPIVVIDIGGGSTELVVGAGRDVSFHVSTQVGVVRHSERYIHSDPPTQAELADVAENVRRVFATEVPDEVASSVAAGVAVAGTATSCAAIDQGLDPYDPARVHGYRLDDGSLELMLGRLAQMTVAERRGVPGLHPDRAATIVPGVIVLIQALRRFDLDVIEVSEHDILRGVAAAAATGVFGT